MMDADQECKGVMMLFWIVLSIMSMAAGIFLIYQGVTDAFGDKHDDME